MGTDERTRVAAMFGIELAPAPGGGFQGGTIGVVSAERTGVGVVRVTFARELDPDTVVFTTWVPLGFTDITIISPTVFDFTRFASDGVTPDDGFIGLVATEVLPGAEFPAFTNSGP